MRSSLFARLLLYYFFSLQNIRKQLLQYMEPLGITTTKCCESTEGIRKALVSAFFTQAAIRLEDGQYKTLLGNRVRLLPALLLITLTTLLDSSYTPIFGIIFKEAFLYSVQSTGNLKARRPPPSNQAIYQVSTKKKYLRGVLLIQLNWLPELAPHFWYQCFPFFFNLSLYRKHMISVDERNRTGP
jgi:hypothetical protein